MTTDIDPARAMTFLASLGADGSEEAMADALEGMRRPAGAETLRPVAPYPTEMAESVDRTLEKIGKRKRLDAAEGFALEAIIIPDKRPAINILDKGQFVIDHPLWTHFAQGAIRDRIKRALPAIGRIELPGHPSLPYGGTGFVVGDGLLMTNRHVAEIFCGGLGLRNLVFRSGHRAGIDFEKRVDGGSQFLEVKRVVMIHPYWDMALLRVEGLPSGIVPLELASADGAATPFEIAAIGYPAFDSRNNAAVQQTVFQGVYNVKRLMPGKLNGRVAVDSFGKDVMAMAHDSSTLGGASGSAVINVATGEVVALHFGGLYLESNYGVPASELARDGRVIDAGVRFSGAPSRTRTPWDNYWTATEGVGSARRPAPLAGDSAVAVPTSPLQSVAGAPGRVQVTIPLTISVELGAVSVPAPASVPTRAFANAAAIDAPDVGIVETVAEDYLDRSGYAADFLGVEVPLPDSGAHRADLVEYDLGGTPETELRYEHFSVLMSRSRRMCRISAVNIDGAQSRRAGRPGWRYDPRIPRDCQIMYECYGNPPKFSRGHMTRREDPVWGPPDVAERGNADSMHVTNATPQYQAFNSPIWLALEDYALDHARQDGMRISVFTGPFLASDDPVYHGVAVPVRFWKVIAFIHDDTGRLCATGYEMSQRQSLPPTATEFVYGQFQSPQLSIATQVPIRRIEAESGIDFGPLADCDPLAGVHEFTGGSFAEGPLQSVEQIRFLRSPGR